MNSGKNVHVCCLWFQYAISSFKWRTL